jgi:hypothetical protein
MRIEIDFDAGRLIDGIMAGYPEASAGHALRCTGWDYTRCIFDFVDADSAEPVGFTLERVALEHGLHLLLGALLCGKHRGVGAYVLRDFRDPGNWDSNAADALVQYALFGELIYG